MTDVTCGNCGITFHSRDWRAHRCVAPRQDDRRAFADVRAELGALHLMGVIDTTLFDKARDLLTEEYVAGCVCMNSREMTDQLLDLARLELKEAATT